MFEAPTLAEANVVGNGDVREVSYGSDAGLYVEFYLENEHMAFRSEEEGRPIYEKVPMIRIYTPGDKTKVVVRKVNQESNGGYPSDPQRFPRQWSAFKEGVEATASGFPLEEWPIMTTGQVKVLNAVNIYTVEQLAAVSDAALDGLGHGGRSLRDQAVAKMSGLTEHAQAAKLEAQNMALQRQIDELRASMAADAPRRGRPPKVEGNDDAD